MATVCKRALLLLLLILALLLKGRPAAAATSGGGKTQSAISPDISFTGCEQKRCTSTNASVGLPLNIALLMPEKCDHFRVAVTSSSNPANRASVALECYDEVGKFNIVRLTSAISPSFQSYQLMVLPSNAWFSVSVFVRDADQLVFIVQADTTAFQRDKAEIQGYRTEVQGDRTSGKGDITDDGSTLQYKSNISIQGTVVVANWPTTQDVILTLDCHEDDIQTDLPCLQNTKESQPFSGPRTSSPSPPSMESPTGRNAGAPRSKIYASTTSPGVAPAPGVVLTVTACGLLILVLALLFGLWYWQRRKLHQRRNSYQHQVLKRQTEGASFRRNQQSQTLDLRLSDIEDQEQFQQLRPPVPKKPRIFVKMTRADSQDNKDARAADVSIDVTEPTEYANVPPSGATSVSRDFAPRGNSSDVPAQGTSSAIEVLPNTSRGGGGSNGRGRGGPRSPKPTIPNDNLFKSLIDEGGVTGPYWFHSTRKPDPKTALKIYRV